MADSNAFLIYQDDNGVSNVNVRFEGEDVWLTTEQLQQLFQTSQQNISLHIRNVYSEGELDENRTHKKYLLVRNEGGRSIKRSISHYNLDIIVAVGMRVKSDVAVRFRQWAIRHLYEFAVKGFTLDDHRLAWRIPTPRDGAIRERLRPRRPRTDGHTRRWLSLLAKTEIWYNARHDGQWILEGVRGARL